MRISLILLTLLLGACANSSVVIPVLGPIGIRIETGEKDDCKAIIVNGKPQSGCASEVVDK